MRSALTETRYVYRRDFVQKKAQLELNLYEYKRSLIDRCNIVKNLHIISENDLKTDNSLFFIK